MAKGEGAPRQIGYRFADPALLETALTHASYAHAYGTASYEELEFLGDSVLQLIVTEFLYRHRDQGADEGEMTSARAACVCRESLTEAAKALALDALIRYVGQPPTAETKMLSDVYEAVTGAVYLDGGLDAAREFVIRTHGDAIRAALDRDTADYKSKLQELIQAREHSGTAKLSYRAVGQTETERKKNFCEAVYWQNRELARGSGPTRKEAQKEAAKAAYRALTTESRA